MPVSEWNNDSDDLHDWEYPDVEDQDDDQTDTVACPECGADVYEDADQCPTCGHYIIHETRAWSDKSLWWIILALLGIVAAILVLGLGI